MEAQAQDAVEEVQEVAQATEDTRETKQETKTDKDGYKQIDFKSASPEEIEARFNRVYGQLKHQQRDISQYRDIARQQSAVIEDLQKGVYAIADHVQDKAIRETETQLKDDLRSAYENGDYAKIAETQAKLTEVQTRKILAEQNKQKPQAQPQQPTHSGYLSASQMADEAVNDGDLTPEQAQIAKAWSGETSESGEPLRPWVTNRGTESRPDPDYVKALLITEELFNDPKYSHLSFEQRLTEVDKKMGLKKSTAKQAVMGGALTGKPRNVKFTLSSDAEKLAIRTKYAGPGKSDAEHIEKYRQQIEKAKQGARK